MARKKTKKKTDSKSGIRLELRAFESKVVQCAVTRRKFAQHEYLNFFKGDKPVCSSAAIEKGFEVDPYAFNLIRIAVKNGMESGLKYKMSYLTR